MPATSPFPGMDPYLEDQWGDVHAALVTYIRDALQPRLPSGLRVRAENRAYVEVDEHLVRQLQPDVQVVEYRPRHPADGGTAVATALTAPSRRLVLHLTSEPVTETFLRVVDTKSGGQVVTVIEVLSPGNKLGGEGERTYIQNQRELLTAGVSLVEIDLVRGGRHVLAAPLAYVPPADRTPYRVCVTRGWNRFQPEWYPIRLQDPLPVVAIPLRTGDADAILALQSLFDQAYGNGRYDDVTDYTIDPVPPLTGDDAAWADQLLRGKGLRR